MCTVTYLPLQEGFIITSNRDERLLRKPATAPQVRNINGVSLLFPQDTEAGGTWIACNSSRRTVCLLNGAFEPHVHNPPYRKSRGLVVLDFFQSKSVLSFRDEYDLEGIEPFTMVITEQMQVHELRWDGKEKYCKQLDASKPNIHSSATLYTKETMALREQWFDKWLQEHKEYQVKDILNFHLFAGDGDEGNAVRMSRFGIVETLSVSCVKAENNLVEMHYADVRNKKEADFSLYTFSSQPIDEAKFELS